jgi:hypothetical protein
MITSAMIPADLRERREVLARELADSDVARGRLALAAALGDSAGRRGLDRLLARGSELAAQISALDTAIAAAEAERRAAAAAEAAAQRRIDGQHLRRLLAERLEMATAIDGELRRLRGRLSRFAIIGAEVEARHAALTGAGLRDDPLRAEAVGGRLAEVMAGLGFDAWLPLARPEIRPALDSLRAAESVAQLAYAVDQDEPGEGEVAA